MRQLVFLTLLLTPFTCPLSAPLTWDGPPAVDPAEQLIFVIKAV